MNQIRRRRFLFAIGTLLAGPLAGPLARAQRGEGLPHRQCLHCGVLDD
jgi:hypothetical protein